VDLSKYLDKSLSVMTALITKRIVLATLSATAVLDRIKEFGAAFALNSEGDFTTLKKAHPPNGRGTNDTRDCRKVQHGALSIRAEARWCAVNPRADARRYCPHESVTANYRRIVEEAALAQNPSRISRTIKSGGPYRVAETMLRYYSGEATCP
jgi:hypothetical protein